MVTGILLKLTLEICQAQLRGVSAAFSSTSFTESLLHGYRSRSHEGSLVDQLGSCVKFHRNEISSTKEARN